MLPGKTFDYQPSDSELSGVQLVVSLSIYVK